MACLVDQLLAAKRDFTDDGLDTDLLQLGESIFRIGLSIREDLVRVTIDVRDSFKAQLFDT